ncbi:hypothetical protein [Wolbachia endosymbiont of Trichogramma pretiosum]|uniref:hypothetical protein n=1 Tax=Wolbachia endosymbiont of Trichogramma pretiosum TaxID=125593 RepID=UPI0008396EFC|nr:hypothetical protein [Wolbachia endosymbiont of Trichogramma pretiosum]OCA07049.1 hypothetical protein wTpre_1405 [Wolbachia endosymbiont of Trichogramma pretiosum]
MKKQKISIKVILTIVVQTVGLIWWLAKLDLRVHIHDKFVEKNQELIEIVYRLEERVKNLTEEVNELEAIHKHK